MEVLCHSEESRDINVD